MSMQIILIEGNKKICFDLKDLESVSFELNKEENTYIEDEERKLIDRINMELDLIGINYKLKGRLYILDAILYIVQGMDKDYKYTSVYQYLADKYKVLTTSITKAIQTAINDAWKNTPQEDIERHYTIKTSYNKGVPTPTAFIYFYVNKLKAYN